MIKAKKASVFLFLFIVLFSVAACGVSMRDTSFFALDTVITFHLPPDTPESVLTACEALINEKETVLSRTSETGDIAAFRNTDSDLTVSEDTAAVLRVALSVAEATDGAFDPTLAPLSALWNITGATPAVPSDAAIKEALRDCGYAHLTLNGNTLTKDIPSLSLDLGGCAKGYLCALTVAELQKSNVPYGLVSFGGNIGVFGQKPDGTPWKIGIKNPVNTAAVAGYLTIDAGFVSVSGDYERYFEENGVRYHHIFDGKTGYPADSGIHSVAVWCKDTTAYGGTLADALSTALFVLGTEEALTLYESGIFSFEAVFYTTDGKTILTPGLSQTVYEHATEDFQSPVS